MLSAFIAITIALRASAASFTCDLTQGDGLGLPICKQMALKMNGDLTISEEFTKGTRFVLELHG